MEKAERMNKATAVQEELPQEEEKGFRELNYNNLFFNDATIDNDAHMEDVNDDDLIDCSDQVAQLYSEE